MSDPNEPLRCGDCGRTMARRDLIGTNVGLICGPCAFRRIAV